MRIAVLGASGLIGTALCADLVAKDVAVMRFLRSGDNATDTIVWDPEQKSLDRSRIEGFDAIVNLMGENIAQGRWTAERKRRLRESRVVSTERLVKTLAELNRPPQVLISASAIGFYGNRGEEVVSEDSPPGTGFLSSVCQQWEKAADRAALKGIRVVKARFGVVLSAKGGALASMLGPFRLGLGGMIGSGNQWMSWIAIDDVVGALWHLIQRVEIEGPVNLVAPQPVKNREFTKALGKALSRPTILPLPAFAARLVLGEMAEELLLSSTRASPEVLIRSDYKFRQPVLEEALRLLMSSRRS